MKGLSGTAGFSLERLWEARICRRLAWWREQGRTGCAEDEPAMELPEPWPNQPPGWTGLGRGWAGRWLDSPEPVSVYAQSHWIAEVNGRPQVIMLGERTPRLLFQAQGLAFILTLRGNPIPSLWRQPWPLQGKCQGTWLGDWPRVVPFPSEPLVLSTWQQRVHALNQAFQFPLPPEPTAPPGRCWDCPARNLCADRT